MPSTCLQPCFRSIWTGRQPAFLHHVPFAPGHCVYVSCLIRRGLRAGLRFPTDPRPLNAEDSWTGACYAAWHLALFPRELGSLLWQVCMVQREVSYFCADCRSPVSICKMQRRAQRDSYGTFDFETFVALFNSGTLRHPVTAQFACHKRA